MASHHEQDTEELLGADADLVLEPCQDAADGAVELLCGAPEGGPKKSGRSLNLPGALEKLDKFDLLILDDPSYVEERRRALPRFRRPRWSQSPEGAVRHRERILNH